MEIGSKGKQKYSAWHGHRAGGGGDGYLQPLVGDQVARGGKQLKSSDLGELHNKPFIFFR